MTPNNKWLRKVAAGVECYIHAVPRGGRDRLEGVVKDANGKEYLKIRITAAAEDGKANKAILSFLAKTWKLPVSYLTLLSGETSRKKHMLVRGDPEALYNKLLDPSAIKKPL